MANRVAIVAGLRSPYVKAGEDLKDVRPQDLGAMVLKELFLSKNMDPHWVDEVIVGNTGSPCDAVNISRVIALNAGVPKETSCYTVHRNCASGMESIAQAYDKISSGSCQVVVAGGVESMSQMPLLFGKKMTDLFANLMKAKTLGQKFGVLSKFRPAFLTPTIAIVEGLTDPFCGLNMGQTAEILAREFKLSREEQDQFALSSHQKAVRAMEEGKLKEEIATVYVPPYKAALTEDKGPRKGQSIEQLAKLKPFFDRENGTVTVGNACPITDGAAFVILMSEARAKELGLTPLGFVKSYAFAGLEPERMGLGPVFSTYKVLKKTGLKLKDIKLIELNEAFAAQVLACVKAFGSKDFAKKRFNESEAVGEVNMDLLNVNGGAIALGHPVGSSGTRLALTTLLEMKRRSAALGLATLCIGGGQGGSLILESN